MGKAATLNVSASSLAYHHYMHGQALEETALSSGPVPKYKMSAQGLKLSRKLACRQHTLSESEGQDSSGCPRETTKGSNEL